VLRADVTDRVQPGVVYTTFHFPESGANVVTTENSDWATNCPEYKVTAVEAIRVAHPAEWRAGRRSICRSRMNVERLVAMVNDIAAFFAGEAGPALRRPSRNHLRRFWEPRMRRKSSAAYQDDPARLSNLSAVGRARIAELAREPRTHEDDSWLIHF